MATSTLAYVGKHYGYTINKNTATGEFITRVGATIIKAKDLDLVIESISKWIRG